MYLKNISSRFGLRPRSIVEEDDQDEDKSHENNKNNEDKITKEEKVEISNIIEHINSTTKYYKKIFEPITK